MMTQSAPKRRRYSNFLLWAVCGVGGYFGGLYLAQNGVDFGIDIDSDRAFALAVAAFYGLIGTILLLLILFPAFRGTAMAADDAADLDDNPRLFIMQCISMIAWGLALGFIALAGDGLPLEATTGAILCAIAMVIGAWTYWCSLPLLDELYRLATLEAGVVSYGMVLLLTGGWAGLAHLGLLGPPSMLTIVTLFWVVALAATVLVTSLRGMLKDG